MQHSACTEDLNNFKMCDRRQSHSQSPNRSLLPAMPLPRDVIHSHSPLPSQTTTQVDRKLNRTANCNGSKPAAPARAQASRRDGGRREGREEGAGRYIITLLTAGRRGDSAAPAARSPELGNGASPRGYCGAPGPPLLDVQGSPSVGPYWARSCWGSSLELLYTL